jgi:nitrogen fixation/metabolism regulation signal transduction histidine kinase
MELFRLERSEKEESHRYLETVFQHVGIGLISCQPDGTVELINNAAKRLLRVSHLKSITSLESFSPELVDTLFHVKSGERKLVKVNDNDEVLHLAVYATGFLLGKKHYLLVSIHNIQSELEEQEMKSWQNLIRVLTHEIMNSVTPIASLASTVNGLLRGAENTPAGLAFPEAMTGTSEDIKSAVETIQKRSEGLLHFVENYRSLTRIPKPDYRIFPVSELFSRVRQLMQAHLSGRDIEFRATVDPESLELTADPELIEQVLINLVLNALDAVGERPGSRITLRGCIDERSRIIIQVSDNGPGIVGEAIEKIFIPFFTTKPNGSGIGLSLARQIMRLHGGSIGVRSEPERETVFTIRF